MSVSRELASSLLHQASFREINLFWDLVRLSDTRHTEVRRLAIAGARFDLYGQNDGLTPLHLAARDGKAKVVTAMVAAGAPLEVRGGIDATPLHVAAECGREEVCRVLLQAGADLRAVNGRGLTPMALAGRIGWGGVVCVFLAQPGMCFAEGELNEALLGVAAKNSQPQYLQTLLDRLCGGADRLRVAFLAAVRGGNLPAVRCLVEMGADWQTPERGRSVLQLAKRDAHDLKRYLRALQTGAAVEAALDGEPDAAQSRLRRDSLEVL